MVLSSDASSVSTVEMTMTDPGATFTRTRCAATPTRRAKRARKMETSKSSNEASSVITVVIEYRTGGESSGGGGMRDKGEGEGEDRGGDEGGSCNECGTPL